MGHSVQPQVGATVDPLQHFFLPLMGEQEVANSILQHVPRLHSTSSSFSSSEASSSAITPVGLAPTVLQQFADIACANI